MAIKQKTSELKVIFRVDASVKIGTGHLQRCLTIASELKKSSQFILFISHNMPIKIQKWILLNGFQFRKINYKSKSISPIENRKRQEIDAQKSNQIIKSIHPDIVIVDHYELNSIWESFIKKNTKRLIVIDDEPKRDHYCDALIDSNLHHRKNANYKKYVPKSCKLFLGPKYFPLRKEFLLLRKKNRYVIRKKIKQLFVFFSGSDPTNETLKVIRALKFHPSYNFKTIIIAGGLNPHYRILKKEVDGIKMIQLFKHVDHISRFMNSSDISIGAGGTTTWERCFLGLPSFVTVLAENQKEISSAVAHVGAIKLMGEASQLRSSDYSKAIERLTYDERKKISKRAQCLVDGNGTKRICNELFRILK